MRPRSCSSICLVRIGDSPTRTPATNAPSTVGRRYGSVERHADHHHQDGGDDGGIADEIVVGPADDEEHDLPADGEAQCEEDQGAEYAMRANEGAEVDSRHARRG